MTPYQAIDNIDAMMPNSYGPMDKLKWLNELDGRVMQEIFAMHELNDGEELPEW